MSIVVRDGKFDVVVVAGPNIEVWPSIGARAISSICAEMGLTVGMFGGENIRVIGVIPLAGTGGLVLAQDVQNRIHRIQVRAVVRMNAVSSMPDPFPGSVSQGLIPISTARRLKESGLPVWNPGTAILGTGNKALRFGTSLLQSGIREVVCVEMHAQWGAKRFAGWEVERRRFEESGGKIIEGKPVSLTPKSALLWQLRISDAEGTRIYEVGRVVSAGPFSDAPSWREYPPGSSLFELDQTAPALQEDDVEGWTLEEERGRWLAGKLVRSLIGDLGERKEKLERVLKRARVRLKRYQRHREEPFTPGYQGKWVAGGDIRRIRSFSGVPQKIHTTKPVASIECIEEIGCNLCELTCPESAIAITRVKEKFLDETLCTACGICLKVCPSDVPVLVHEMENRSTSHLTLPWTGEHHWKPGELATLLNRRGESLGSARVVKPKESVEAETEIQIKGKQLVQLEVPTHLLWEARSLRQVRAHPREEASAATALAEEKTSAHVDILLDGEKRLARDGVPLSMGLFEFGGARPQEVLVCLDGTCRLCEISVDGVKKLACQTAIHRGMAVKTTIEQSGVSLNFVTPDVTQLSLLADTDAGAADQVLCPCLNVSREQIIERIRQARLGSPEAIVAVSHVGEGKCHGQLCMGAFRRLLAELGIDAAEWIDWRFPSSEWVLTP